MNRRAPVAAGMRSARWPRRSCASCVADWLPSATRTLGIALIVAGGFGVGCTDNDRGTQGRAPNGSDPVAAAGTGDQNSPPSAEVVGDPWFESATAGSGIDFVHNSGVSEVKPFPAANGSGLGAIDFDLDGLADLFFACGTEFPVNLETSTDSDRLYRNLGDMKFLDVSHLAGVDYPGYSIGVTVGDFDNDGFPDLYVSCYGNNLLYQNQGDGSFQRVEERAGVADEQWATSTMFFDADNDGDLDLYVCNYGYWTLETNQYCEEKGIRLFCNPKIMKPCRDTFYRNLGDGTFRDDTQEAGLADRDARAQGVIAADLNDDGFLDIYLGNDLNANSFFINDGTGHFLDETELSGVAYDHRGNSQAGMGLDAADTNRDGRFDLFVTNFKNEHNSLYESRGSGLFFEVSAVKGLAVDSLPYVAWGTVFADFDLDGWLDLFVANGHVDNNRELTGEDAPFKNPALLWVNEKGRFRCLRESAGDYFRELHSSRGLALVDLDNDGDEDVVVGHQDEAPSLVRNLAISNARDEQVKEPRSIQIQWIGQNANRSGIGVKFSCQLDGKLLVDQITAGGSYLSASDLRSTFAVPADLDEVSLEVTFPGGKTQTVPGLRPGEHYVLIEGTEPDAPVRVQQRTREP